MTHVCLTYSQLLLRQSVHTPTFVCCTGETSKRLPILAASASVGPQRVERVANLVASEVAQLQCGYCVVGERLRTEFVE